MGRLLQTLWVVPDRARAAAAREDSLPAGTQVWTVARLLQHVCGLRSRRPVSALASRAVVASALWDAGDGPWDRGSHEPAFVRAAQDLIQRAKLGGLGAERFAEIAGASDGPRSPPLRFLARVFAFYERRMEALGWSDEADAWVDAKDALAAPQRPAALNGFERLEIRALHALLPFQRQVFVHLARACEAWGMDFELRVPGVGKGAVDAATDSIFAAFEAELELSPTSVVKALPDPAEHPLLALAEGLFEAPSVKRRFPDNLPFEVWDCVDTRAESQHLARRVLELAQAGVPLNRMAVVHPHHGPDSRRTVDALKALGLRAESSEPRCLGQTHVGRLALGLFRLVEEQFPAAGVAELLSSRFLPRLKGSAAGVASAVLRDAGIRDDQVGAVGSLGAYAVRLEAHARRLLASGRKEAAAETHEVAQRCAWVTGLATRFPADLRLRDWLEAWWQTLEELGLLEAAQRADPWTEGSGPLQGLAAEVSATEAQAARVLSDVVAELRAALACTGLGEGRATRRGFERFLKDACAGVVLERLPPGEACIRVLSLSQTLGIPLDCVFLAGLVEGAFPRPEEGSMLWSDDDSIEVNRAERREVFRVGAGSGDERDGWQAAEDRLLLASLIAGVRSRAVFSFARVNQEGGEQLPSSVVTGLLSRSDVRALRRGPLETSPLEAIASERELRERVSLLAAAPEEGLRAEGGLGAALLARLSREEWWRDVWTRGQIERERLRFFEDPQLPPGPYTGLIAHPSLRDALETMFRFDKDRPLSASALSRFGNCRFQGFLERSLHLRERTRTSEATDLRTQGSFWHRILEVLIPELAALGLLGRPLEEIPQAALDRAVARAAEEAEQEGHVGHPALWKISRERARTMVQRLLDSDHRGLPFPGHAPSLMELPFGRPEAPTAWREVKLPAAPGEQPIWLEGLIDRVDVSPAGGLAVLDYKSGRVEASKARERVLAPDFQLPIYLLAARASGHEGPLSAGWLSLRQGHLVDFGKLLGDSDSVSLEALLATHPDERARLAAAGVPNLANAAHDVVGRLRAGDFSTRPLDCAHCHHQAVCRIPEPAERS